MKIAENFFDLIGNTPLLRLNRYMQSEGISATILAKLELFNPAGSIKDRAACYMIEEAEKQGKLTPGATIIEPTSGNTGIGLAAAAIGRGYRVVLTMPETMSQERRDLLKAYGAELVLTAASEGMKGAIAKAEELFEKTDNAFIPSQFKNPANAKAHYMTTGPEIWRDTQGELDFLVAGVGTGGTISGTGKYLKEQNDKIKLIAVEPYNSAVISGGTSGAHKLQGIGAGFLPDLLDKALLDEVVRVKDDDAYRAVKLLAQTEGILVGISSGAALSAATEVAKREENRGKTIAVIFPDTGEHYISTGVFNK